MLVGDRSPINRESKVPLYHQLKEWLINQIEFGNLDRGGQIPSENTLCSLLGMSRTTVREALNQLVSEGWLYRVRGIGTFVKDSQVEPSLVQKLTSFAEDMQEKHIPYASELLYCEVVPATLKMAARLQIAPNADVVHLERLGSAEGEPLVLADTYLPVEYCPDIKNADFTNRSLYDLLEKVYGLIVVKARRTLQTSVANEYEAKKLNITPGDPIQVMSTIAFLGSGNPVEYSKLRFRGDRSRFVFTLHRPRTDK
ncbi:MAG: GntR family transcriptional regulator [Anaerolineales bacterium]|nr:GntR family transcriptional regulator [Anaerolineales bacterium]